MEKEQVFEMVKLAKAALEDKKAEESGELIFSYGSDEVELHQVASVMWRMNDLNCSLLMMDNDIEQSELLTMVQEIIDNQ